MRNDTAFVLAFTTMTLLSLAFWGVVVYLCWLLVEVIA